MAHLPRLFIDASPITEPRVSGIGHMTSELVKALDKSKDNGVLYEINLIVCRDKKEYLAQWGLKNVRIITLPIKQRFLNLFWKFDLLPPMDLVFGKGIYLFPNYKNWRLLFSKSFTFVCDISYIKFPQYIEPKNLDFLTKNIQKWIHRTDKVLTISHSAQKEIITELHIPKDKVKLISCGVNRGVFYPRSEDEIEKIKATLGLTKNYILYVGNIEPRKNLETLIDAYVQLPLKTRAAFTLLLIGGGGWLNESIVQLILKAQQEGFDVVHPKSYIPDSDLPGLFSGASLLVHPAYYEGFGISPLQAMACGTPVIAANNSSMPEVVESAGLLVDAHDTVNLSVKIKEVLGSKSISRQLSDAGLRQAKKFSWDESAAQLSILVKEAQ